MKIPSETLNEAHATHLVQFLRQKKENRNSSRHDPLPSAEVITKIVEKETEEYAVLIAQTEISCLDDLSLEGDIPDDISKMSYKIDSY
jgi:hypothetical protein